MSALVDKLLCEHVKRLTPYESARRLFAQGDGELQQVWLNANESPYSDEYTVSSVRFNRYPDCQPKAVVEGYARYSGLSPQQILVTRGADEGIELLIRAFCEPAQDAILICPPTYGMYEISAQTCNVGVEKAPLKADFSLDVEAIKRFKNKVKMVFICSPNNPTGTTVNKADIIELLTFFKDSALVVVDEAYIEFDWQNQWAGQLRQHTNLVILRTLSKAFALAGLRCGFSLASEDIITALLKVIAPYPVPDPVAQIAAQALSTQGCAKMHQQVIESKQQSIWLKKQLSQYPQVDIVGDNKANFILFRLQTKSQLMDYLVKNNLFIRDQSKQHNLVNCLRITVGDEQQNRLFAQLIQQFFQLQEQAV